MRIDLLTLFPDFFTSPLRTGLLAKALAAGKLQVNVHDLREWTTDKHHTADDVPYGGGGGMVMLAEPLLRAIRAVRAQALTDADAATAPLPPTRPRLIYLSPQGKPLTRDRVAQLAAEPTLMLLCGAYEGIDERVIEAEVDEEISLGDYVLNSGEPAALCVLSAVMRRLEGVLGNPDSVANDSFEQGLLDFPHYTRPEVVEGRTVPPILLSGHHANVAKWRHEQALIRTAQRRPELLHDFTLTRADRKLLNKENLLRDPRRPAHVPLPAPSPAPSLQKDAD